MLTYLIPDRLSDHKIAMPLRHPGQNLKPVVPKLITLIAELFEKPVKCGIRQTVWAPLKVTGKRITREVEQDDEEKRNLAAVVTVLLAQSSGKAVWSRRNVLYCRALLHRKNSTQSSLNAQGRDCIFRPSLR